MRRRDFIKNSAYALSATALLSGCDNDKTQKAEKQVVRRKFKDIEVPLLGFGCMRLPMRNEKEVDMVELDRMIAYAMSHGINYFDTAYMYVDSQSESAIGEILSKYDRKSYFIADKLPIHNIEKPDDIRKIFDEQLKKCRVDYFDFYMAHNICKHTYGKYFSLNIHEELLKLKKEGKIKYIGFSFHGDPEMLEKVLEEKNWDFCQLQINYLDWELINASEQYSIARDAEVPVIVMEPLRGGALVNLPPEPLAVLKRRLPNANPVDFAFRWVSSLEGVVTVLSGMSNLDQVRQNAEIFENFNNISMEERFIAVDVARAIQSQGEINCTACKYCIEYCPRGINIPALISLYNLYKVNKDPSKFKFYYETIVEEERAEACVKCGICKGSCPQGLDIPAILEQIAQEYKRPLKKS